ncbi:MAG: hypothetical protein JNL72_05335 [Flavipsychrobacter sp.]|nr:hypothetical protein [Flavipsychrobacter sp.]
MRIILALLLSLVVASPARAQWKNELFAAGGIAVGNTNPTTGWALQTNREFAASFGFRFNPGWKHIFISFGSGIDYVDFYKDGHYYAATGAGTGFKTTIKRVTVKAGAEMMAMLNLTGWRSFVTATPHASATYRINGKEIGLIYKYMIPSRFGYGYMVAGIIARLN